MGEYILLGILCVSTFFALVLPALLEIKNINKNDPVIKEHIKEKNKIKNDLIYILSELCRSENCCIKGKANIINGYLTGIDDGFYLFYPLVNREFIKFVLPLKYWDIFSLKIDCIDEHDICRTVDLREEREENK